MRLTALRIYPVKSMRGYDVPAAHVERWGLADDRRWAALLPDGTELTAREEPRLLTVSPVPTPDGLVLRAPGRAELAVARPREGTAYRSDWLGPMTDAGPDAAQWLTAVLGRAVRLGHQQDPAGREIGEGHGGRPGDALNLADTAPLLLTTEASLRRLDQLVAQTAAERGEPRPDPLSMVRFRPNLVIDGEKPFAEHDWLRLRIGTLALRFAESCDRCVLPTYDPDTLARSHEPTRTLARYRRWSGKVWFGIRLVPETVGELRVGDEVELLAAGLAG